MSVPRLGAVGWLLAVGGAMAAANGAWTWLDPAGWFAHVTPHVPPFNAHFVRDVGAAYVAVGAAVAWAGLSPVHRGPLAAVAALFLGLHALGHAVEMAAGQMDAHHLLEDLPLVHAPALALAALAARTLWRPVAPSLPQRGGAR